MSSVLRFGLVCVLIWSVTACSNFQTDPIVVKYENIGFHNAVAVKEPQADEILEFVQKRAGSEIMSSPADEPYMVESKAFIPASEFVSLDLVDDQRGLPALNIQLSPKGSEMLAAHTKRNVGSHMALVVKGELLMAPIVRETIPGPTLLVSGNFSSDELKAIIYSVEVVETKPAP